jgi:two-component system sensor histidine kinase ArlS
MKNSNNGYNQNHRHRLNKLLSLPLEGVRFIQQLLREKLEFSILFKLSLNYYKIFLKAMIMAGLGILLIFGAFTIISGVSEDYSALEEFLATKLKAPDINDQEVQLQLNRFAREEDLPLMIFDQSHTLILATDFAPTHENFTRLLSVVPMRGKIYLALNKDSINKIRSISLFEALPFIGVREGESSHVPFLVVSYTDLSPSLAVLICLAQTMLVVYAIVFFFGLISISMIGRGFFLPIKEMTQTVRDISTRNLNLRCFP